MNDSQAQNRLDRAFTWILILGLICLGLALTIVFLVIRAQETPPSSSEDIREEAVQRLVDAGTGIYDSHPDADVGRLLQPNLKDRSIGEISISTNHFGLRERSYEIPKPDETLRVVLLGDSFIFGYGIAAEERLGVHLERWLRERSNGFTGKIECLHIGVTSWDIPAAANYIRRQLSELRPDLVLHLSLPNDIEGTVGVRGFGAWSKFYPRYRQRADSVIRMGFPIRELGFEKPGYLRYGLDHESRTRYEDAATQARLLKEALEAYAIPYRLLLHYRHLLSIGREYFLSELPDKQMVYLSEAFGIDRKYWNSNSDIHWNPQGHLKIAKMLYGLITRDHLLPQLNLDAWPEADAIFTEIAVRGREEAMRDVEVPELLIPFELDMPGPLIDFENLTSETAAQIHGGIDLQRRVSPYASFILENSGNRLEISGTTFERRELGGALLRIFVDEIQVGEVRLEAGQLLDLSYEIPTEVSDRSYLSIRFESDDFVYVDKDLQHCVVFLLNRIQIS